MHDFMENLKAKVGPLPLWSWVVLAVGVIVIVHGRGKKQPAVPVQLRPNPDGLMSYAPAYLHEPGVGELLGGLTDFVCRTGNTLGNIGLTLPDGTQFSLESGVAQFGSAGPFVRGGSDPCAAPVAVPASGGGGQPPPGGGHVFRVFQAGTRDIAGQQAPVDNRIASVYQSLLQQYPAGTFSVGNHDGMDGGQLSLVSTYDPTMIPGFGTLQLRTRTPALGAT